MDPAQAVGGIENDRFLCKWIAVLHVILLALVTWQLLWNRGGGPGEGEAQPVFAGIACLLLIPGTVLFWRVNGAGWVLLFLADLCVVLQVLSNLNEGWRTGQIVWNDLSGLAAGIGFGGLLFVPGVYRLFACSELRTWVRAERRVVRVKGEITFFGDRSSEVLMTDASVSGCSFLSESRIPVSERVLFKGIGADDALSFQIQVIRELGPAEIYTLQARHIDLARFPFRYGGKFVKRVNDSDLLRLQGAGLQRAFQG